MYESGVYGAEKGNGRLQKNGKEVDKGVARKEGNCKVLRLYFYDSLFLEDEGNIASVAAAHDVRVYSRIVIFLAF